MTWNFETRQIHAGQIPDAETGSRALPIYQTTSYVFDSVDQAANRFALSELGPIYTRLNNPTNEVVENRIADLEGGIGALLVSSGQAAETLAILTVAQQGDNIVSSPSLYGGTRNLFANTLPRFGVDIRFIDDPEDPAAWEALADERTVAFFGETIPNPKGDILDIEAVAAAAHRVGVPLIVDNTVATPYLLRPIEWGADIVVHSATKYLGGHGTAVAGAIIDAGTFDFGADPQRFPRFNEPDPSYGGLVYARDFGPNSPFGANVSFIFKCRLEGQRDFGFAASPFNAFLIAQGIETLSLRLERHVANARAVAEYLEGKDGVAQVRYASLKSSPYYTLAQKYTPRGAGAIVTADLAGGREAGRAFIDALTLHSHVANIGDVRSLAIHPASTTHSQVPDEGLAAAGITPGTVRLSVGLEHIDDILADIHAGLAAARAVATTEPQQAIV
ncbi:O-acetylhomoserine aminocarboxypropyltransferase [Bowdeniella nasicola]|uniref:O-acetylhomoserine aminocarboxypropyltransferase n=1 Tax=Bowdeniella nasicola TaxID=208480 RepID=A0A1Q5Q2V2_9ACTO|nr:PLP-dependent transferase [Bowdeniella nasicola]OKL54174.1 O-acetylhomoserine aminocarboxypropyltransferase [Bowdeniella nasicola]